MFGLLPHLDAERRRRPLRRAVVPRIAREAFTPQAPAISVSMGFPPAAAGAGGVGSPSMS